MDKDNEKWMVQTLYKTMCDTSVMVNTGSSCVFGSIRGDLGLDSLSLPVFSWLEINIVLTSS